jgi:hypothetical protein
MTSHPTTDPGHGGGTVEHSIHQDCPAVGAVNGLVLGLVLAGVALAWKGNPYLGLVVGGSPALNTLVTVCLGGIIPLAQAVRGRPGPGVRADSDRGYRDVRSFSP